MEREPYVEFTPEMEKLDHLIKGIPVAMMTTITTDGKLQSFPLLNQDIEFDGSLWFLISKNSPFLQEMQKNTDINLSYSGNGKYISITGTVEFIKNRDMVREIWLKPHETWFPEGPSDPNIQLLKVNVRSAEYWEEHTSPVYKIIDFVRTATGKPAQKENHGSLDLKH
ncbi:MAG TPA: pyridoxamine 5'-phosphate oxidase family protein [Bdellovibrio sp.]|uniref:pyridoxamine 5'-phosphate oxidase family protein n=1 Tax=Bdellovibrio sp. TaxID=28201 RepID=UPI002F12E67A